MQLPQFISNYRNKSAEALSPWFLAEWLLVSARLLDVQQQQQQQRGLARSLPGLTGAAGAGITDTPLPPVLQGDTSNLLGCLLQGEQLPTTTYTAM